MQELIRITYVIGEVQGTLQILYLTLDYSELIPYY